MNLLKWMLATAMVLDAALMMTGPVSAASTSPDQSVGYSLENTSFSNPAGLAPSTRQ
jgi:hypothetical protein